MNNWITGEATGVFEVLFGFNSMAYFLVFLVSYGFLAIVAIIITLFGRKFKYPITIKFIK
ncbi:hypothetical protein [Evansella vedderi]|nr:hypothetical protein [Evansella vedderi]